VAVLRAREVAVLQARVYRTCPSGYSLITKSTYPRCMIAVVGVYGLREAVHKRGEQYNSQHHTHAALPAALGWPTTARAASG
jgi:hypothetical protein